MPKLSARFTINIPSPCLLAWPDDHTPEIVATLGSFCVVAKLFSAEDWRSKHKDDVCWTTGLSQLEIEVSRLENDAPPDVVVTHEGMRDLTMQGEYLRSKLPAYQEAVLEIANRILQFFQYSLRTPLVRPIPNWDHSLHNPIWLDDSEKELRGGTYTVKGRPVPGLNGKLGVKKLTPAEFPELQSFVAAPTEPQLADTLLSDAQGAWFEGSLRRSVLELAICTDGMDSPVFSSPNRRSRCSWGWGSVFDERSPKCMLLPLPLI